MHRNDKEKDKEKDRDKERERPAHKNRDRSRSKDKSSTQTTKMEAQLEALTRVVSRMANAGDGVVPVLPEASPRRRQAPPILDEQGSSRRFAMPPSEEPAASAADDRIAAGQWSQVVEGHEDPIDESAAAARLCQVVGTLPSVAGETVAAAAHR